MGTRLYAWLLSCCLVAIGCGDNNVPGGTPGPEAGTDDARIDSPLADAPTDTVADAVPDAGIDAPADAAVDSPIDSPTVDAAIDAPTVDAPIDSPTVDAPPDSPTCNAPKTLCGALCTDLDTDDNNCGTCNNACGAGNHCTAGKCCSSSETSCGGTCTNTDTDNSNCGTCGNTCTGGATCSSGTCVCPINNPDRCNGTCTDKQTDENNCGACGTVCPGTNTCSNGKCCPSGTVNCNGTCVDLNANNTNCGSCNNACTGGETCQTGQCACPVNNPDLCNGTCTDTDTDSNNCGTCGNSCGAGNACSSGKCCPTGQTNCNGTCVDTDTSATNCGVCGNNCGAGNSCSDGTCCPTGQTNCNGTCVNLGTNPLDCGTCGHVCTGGTGCVGGNCTCPVNNPDLCSGQCTNNDSDPNNCGTCGNKCGAGLGCSNGVCCPAGQQACNGVCVDVLTSETNCGVCGNTCGSGATCQSGLCECGINQQLCGNSCVTTNVDPQNCGDCGVTCGGATPFCVSNGCAASCPVPTSACGNECVNKNTDNENCGTCGNVCPNGTGCDQGVCVTPVTLNPPPAGKCDGGGPPIDVLPTSSGGCTGQIAGVTFTFALCTCNDIGSTHLITTDGFDSTQGPYVPGQNGAGVGTNHNINDTDVITVGGDLWVTKGAELAPSGDMLIKQRFYLDGSLKFAKLLTVNEDSFITGTVTKQGGQASFKTIDVLTMSPCPPNNTGGVQYGSCVDSVPDIQPPCDCDGTTKEGKIDVRAIVEFHSNAAQNDNASIGLDQTVLDNPSGSVRLDLPCGKYYVNSINGTHPITIVAHGHTALFVGGSITNSQALNFDLDPTATLDIFVGGVQKASQNVTVGNPLYPRETRMFFGSNSTSGNGSCTRNSECTSGRCVANTCQGGPNLTDAFQISGNSFLNGLFYAGHGTINISNPLTIFGAIFAKDVSASSDAIIHFDRAATTLGQECGEGPPPSCVSCKDCNNQACSVFGQCGDCQVDEDCCAPLRCNTGTGVCELVP